MLAVILVINSKMIEKTVADDTDKKTEERESSKCHCENNNIKADFLLLQQ
jgi:hypothetical protein